MRFKFFRFLAGLTILVICSQTGCERFNNDKDELLLQCGPDIQAGSTYLKIDSTDTDDFEAIIYSNGVVKEASRTYYGCISIPANTDLNTSFLIRSQTTRKGVIVRYDSNSRPGTLSYVTLSESEEFQNQTISLQCQGEKVVTGNKLLLKRSAQDAQKLVYNINRYILRNEQEKVVQEGLLPPTATILELSANIPEGQYQLRTEAIDAFNFNEVPRVSECHLAVDLTPPSVKLLVAGRELSLFEEKELIVSPGQELKFFGIDTAPTQIFACSRKRQREYQAETCDDADFLPVNVVTAPEEGIWDLYFYAADSLGQQSIRQSQTIVVYHQDRVNEVNVLAKLSRLSSAAFDQLSAWAALVDADRVLRRLSLKREQENTRWSFIGAFWELNKILKARWNKTFAFKGVNIKTGQNSRYWLATGFKQNIYIFEDETLKAELDKVYHMAVKGTNSIWTYSYTSGPGAEIRYYEGAELKTSWPAEGDKLHVSETGKTAVMSNVNSLKLFSVSNPLQAIKTFEFPRGEILFSHADRYMFHKTEKRVTRVDLVDNSNELFYEVPDVCKIIGIAIRKDQELYILSTTRSSNIPTPQDDNNSCGLYRVNFESENAPAAVSIVPDSGKYKADQMVLSTESGQRLLIFGNRLSSLFYAIDVTVPDASPIEFELARGEAFTSAKSVSLYNPIFLLETTQSRYLLDFSSERMKKVNFGLLTDSCEAVPVQELVICSSEDRNNVTAYETRPDRQLVPEFSLKYEDSEISPATSRKGLARFTGNVQAKKVTYYNNDKPIKEFQLKERPKALAISDNGNLASVVTENGTLSVFSSDRLLAEANIDEPYVIISLRISDRGDVFTLLADANGNKAFEIWKYQDRKLQRIGERHNNLNTYYDTIALSPNGEYCLVYFGLGKMDFLVNRPFSLFDNSSRFIKDLKANNSQPTFSPDSKGLYLIRGKNVDYYSIEKDAEKAVAENLTFEPYEIVAADILIGTTLYKSYNLQTGQIIGDGGSVTVIQDNYLAMLTATEGDVEVYSPDGKDLILSYRPPELEELIPTDIKGHPESPYFEVEMLIAGDNLRVTKVTKTYLTDILTVQEWLNRWPLP